METINKRVLPLSKKNYELWLVRYAEGELTAAERQEVEAWLAEHSEAAEELRLYNEAPRLQRDESVRYVAAMPPQTKPLWSTAWRWVAAAAVVAAFVWSVLPRYEEPATLMVAEATTTECNDETAVPAVEKTPVKAATARPRTAAPELLIAIADEAMESTINQEDTEVIETIESPQAEQPSSLVYVDNLIVFDEEPESLAEYVTVNEVTYTNTESSINPIGYFISTFIKANK